MFACRDERWNRRLGKSARNPAEEVFSRLTPRRQTLSSLIIAILAFLWTLAHSSSALETFYCFSANMLTTTFSVLNDKPSPWTTSLTIFPNITETSWSHSKRCQSRDVCLSSLRLKELVRNKDKSGKRCQAMVTAGISTIILLISIAIFRLTMRDPNHPIPDSAFLSGGSSH